MSGRNKGFDPLSSLFEAPDPSRGLPLPDVDEEDLSDPGAKVELTDPFFKRPAPPPTSLAVPVAPAQSAPSAQLAQSVQSVQLGPSSEDKLALARRLAMEAVARAQVPPPAAPAVVPPAAPAVVPSPAPVEDKVALARRLAAEAMARSQPTLAAPPPAAPREDKEALARRLAAQALARVDAAPPTPTAAPAAAPASGPSASDKADLARRLAAAAQAAAGEPGAKRVPSKEDRARAGKSRVASLAARARKPVNALDAARAAAQQEEEAQAHELRKEANRLRDVVQDLIPEWLPGIGTVFVANAIAVEQRQLLKALWKGHRSKFLSDGELERAVGAAAVLAALDQAPEGTLVAAHAVTDASDYLVWLDLDKRSLVAAFADARAYFAQGT